MRLKSIVLSILSITLFYPAKAQMHIADSTRIAHYYLMADSLQKNGDYVASQKYATKYIQAQVGNDSNVIRGKYLNIVNLRRLGKYKESLELCQATIALNKETVNINSFSEALLTNLGILNNRLGHYSAAYSNLKESLAIQEVLYKYQPEELSLGFLNIGIMYKNLGIYDLSLKNINKAVFLIKSSGVNNELLLAKFYNNLGDVYVELGDYQLAIDYLSQSLHIYEVYSNEYQYELSIVNFSLGIAYSKISEHNLTLKHTDRAFNIAEKLLGGNHPFVIILKSNYASILIDIGKKKEGRILYEEGLEYFRQTNSGNIPLLCQYLANIGKSYLPEEPDKALKPLLEAASEFREHSGDKNTAMVEYYLLIAEAYLLLKSEAKAMAYIKKGIEANQIGDSTGILRDKNLMLKALSLKGSVLMQKGKDEDLYLAMRIFLQCDELISELRGGHRKYEDKIMLGEIANEVYEKAIEVSHLLFKKSGNQAVFNTGFQFSERSKASVLLDEFHKAPNRNSTSSIKDSLLLSEYQLTSDIDKYEAQLSNERIKSLPNLDTVRSLQGKIINMRQTTDSLNDQISMLFPDFQIKNRDTQVPDIKLIKKELLGKDKTLIEYFLTESTLYIFLINQQNTTLKAISVDSVFYEHLKRLRNQLANPNMKEHTSEDFANFCQSASYLYQVLVSPVSALINTKNVTIIPGDQLALIPFSTLLSDSSNFAEGKYQKLSYWFKTHNISYANSAAILFAMQNINHQTPKERGVLAFAPSFENTPDIGQKTSDNVRSSLGKLVWTEKEIEGIKDYFTVETFQSEAATEMLFRKKVSEYSVIHIASHSLVDDENPMFSKIAFSLNESDSTDDGYLHTFELQNLSFNADMVVLSACNTGFGKIQKGEGVRSLGYAFAYAGVPSVVMSHWQVDDKSTYLLMQDFYRYLVEGNTKSEALRMAKLNLLNHENEGYSNPYYWSAFITYGNDEPLKTKTNHLLYWILGLILLLGIVFVQRRTQQGNSKNNSQALPQ